MRVQKNPFRACIDGLLLLLMAAALSSCSAEAQSPYVTLRPDGSGPFPAVLLAAGCSGFNNQGNNNVYEEKAAALRQGGYVVVFVDVLARRGLKNCSGSLTVEDAAQDLLAAAEWARKQRHIDARRISAIGWSFGGGVVVAALAQMPRTHPAFYKAVALYPPCPPRYARGTTVPLLVLLAALDDVSPPQGCVRIAQGSPPGSVKSITYQNARHAFDARGLPERVRYQFGTLGYNAQADRAAWAEIRAFLK